MKKLIATEKALSLIRTLKEKYGEILFEQSAGCCDGTAPMCYIADTHYVSSQLVILGYLEGVPYYVEKTHLSYIQYLQQVLDVTDGNGTPYSLDSLENYTFIIRSQPFEKPQF